ncbi:MAG: adenosylmethionine-8-amino-7-oxononanoate transaminase [Bacteroidetes bacterium]|nr:adenosylmethionine-8-amino-7-oxononanoate transaminase [Bacteroidota bacterium]
MKVMTSEEKDRAYVWHPFTPQLPLKSNINITRGEGVYLIDDKENKYLDAISSWWVNLHGHCNSYIAQKISEQLKQLEHSIFSDFTHPSAILLAERLLKHLPVNQSKIFYSDNGSTAVEVALKMALQFWHNQEQTKTVFIAFENAYHGDTFGSMSVGARNVFSNAFEALLFDVQHIPLPTDKNINEVKDQLISILKKGNVAGFIFEPLVQGASGMRMYETSYLDELIAICNKHKVITIADEVMTGFGRTGKFFASDYLLNKPDIFCLSKGLTGGFMPLGVTSCAGFIHQAYLSTDKAKTFFHGHSYTANATACSAALASLDLMEKEQTWLQIKMIEKAHLMFKEKICVSPKLKNVRVKGTIIAFELKTEEHSHYLNAASQSISSYFLEKGIILRPLGNIFYLIPPYVIKESELKIIYDSIESFLK